MAKNKNNPEREEMTREEKVAENEAAVNEEKESTDGIDENKELSEVKARCEELQKELEKTKDNLLRTIAEYDNFRKRSQKEKDTLYFNSKADVIEKLLPSIDNFERASGSETDHESYKKGIEMTVKGLLEAFSQLGAESFGAVGDEFDPNIHNAVMHVDDESFDENTVCEVFLKGYRLGDRVIRHATVKVAN